MNETLKEQGHNLAKKTRDCFARYKHAKNKLATYDANTRITGRTDGSKRTEKDLDAYVAVDEGRSELLSDLVEFEADWEAVQVETKVVIAEMSLVCTETAANSRISQ